MGSLIFLSPLHPPYPMTIGKLYFTRPGTSTGDILIADMQTFIIQNFNFVGREKGKLIFSVFYLFFYFLFKLFNKI